MYPKLRIDLNKIKHNLDKIAGIVNKANCSIMIVTKVVCADKEIIKIVDQNDNVEYYADSRIENLASIDTNTKKKKVLLRLPMLSDVDRVVKYADISLNSEIETIKALDRAAMLQDTKHKIILMIDLGDLREGIYFTNEQEIFETVQQILELQNIELYGIGVNLTCYGAVIPQNENLTMLADFAHKIEEKFGIKLPVVSGGNSSSLHLIEKNQLPQGINNLRIGEAFYLANETAYTNKIDDMYDDVMLLEAEIIELKEKPSIPVGETGVDAFGQRPVYEDRGIIKRAILSIGKQDIDIDSLTPVDSKIDILGGSSDHMILDVTKSDVDYKLGDIISFKLGYSATLKAFTSKYVAREYINN